MGSPSSSPQISLPLEISGLVKRFHSLTAVDGISLQLNPKECLGLLGPNGAGKSTLIRAVAGRVIPDEGSVLIEGAKAGSAQARNALGWIPQDLAIYPRLSCFENLRAFGSYHGLKRSELTAAIDWCLDWAALKDRAHDIAGTLSGGMKRRLNMAAGMIHRPRVVLMDEPTVGVDPQSRNRIFEMIEALRSEGISLIYTTHYMEEAERLCDRIAIVDHGRIITVGSRDELIESVFANRRQVLMRFETVTPALSAWVEQHHGSLLGATAELSVDHPTEISALLQEAASLSFALDDLTLRRPNLESVFLHLTGRELRD